MFFLVKLEPLLISQLINSEICNLILNPFICRSYKKLKFVYTLKKKGFPSSSPLTCCKAWRRLPWQHPSRWYGWRQSRPVGCWSRSGNRLGWSSLGGTWETRSTASPGRGASRRGHSYTPEPPEETPPDRDAQLNRCVRTDLGFIKTYNPN